MRHFWITYAILIALILMAFAAGGQTPPNQTSPQSQTPAQTPPAYITPARGNEDWNRVRDLVHDEEINVWSSHNRHVRCLFTGATDDFLFCEPRYAREGSGEYRFERADVDKIRLEQGNRNFKATLTVTTVAGVIAGAALPNTSNGGERIIGGLAGGLAGTMAGAIIGGPIAIFVPGHLVYQRPHDPHKSQDSAHSRQGSNAQIPQQAQ
jgi:hypothetical protein